MATSTQLDKDENGKEVNPTLYRGMIGSLHYLTACRPDILFATCLCARFQSAPKELHLNAIERIFRYLIGTPALGLFYPRSRQLDLLSYSDVDFAGSKID
ncbi:hypothetical protein, partial [Ralstonia pseudosolanacearum]|uniref:hypothetical protein n=1 Tax=Ralstonia pseudosolanacearum TaxID=1310165 RepID=UPI003CE8FBD3